MAVDVLLQVPEKLVQWQEERYAQCQQAPALSTTTKECKEANKQSIGQLPETHKVSWTRRWLMVLGLTAIVTCYKFLPNNKSKTYESEDILM